MAAITQRAVPFEGGQIVYTLERKQVKNLNLRVRRDGSVYVSAHPRMSLRTIDAFVSGRGAFVRAAQDRLARQRRQTEALPPPPREECLALFSDSLAGQLPLLAPYGVQRPQLRLREMTSRWGSCAWKSGVITLNTRLFYAPRPCLDYVVLHELCHLVHPDHGPGFHSLMGALMPDYKHRKRLLERWADGEGGAR